MALVERTPTKTWTAREGELYVAAAASITIDNSKTLSGAFISGVSLEAAVKNITITPPETGWEKQDLLGVDGNNFQNQLLDEKPVGTAIMAATMVVAEDEMIEDYVVSGTWGTGGNASAPSGYSRYQVGISSDNELTTCVVLHSPNDDKHVAFALDNARMTKWGDVRIAGPDGHWEQDFTILCLAKDFYYEFKD